MEIDDQHIRDSFNQVAMVDAINAFAQKERWPTDPATLPTETPPSVMDIHNYWIDNFKDRSVDVIYNDMELIWKLDEESGMTFRKAGDRVDAVLQLMTTDDDIDDIDDDTVYRCHDEVIDEIAEYLDLNNWRAQKLIYFDESFSGLQIIVLLVGGSVFGCFFCCIAWAHTQARKGWRCWGSHCCKSCGAENQKPYSMEETCYYCPAPFVKYCFDKTEIILRGENNN